MSKKLKTRCSSRNGIIFLQHPINSKAIIINSENDLLQLDELTVNNVAEDPTHYNFRD